MLSILFNVASSNDGGGDEVHCQRHHIPLNHKSIIMFYITSSRCTFSST